MKRYLVTFLSIMSSLFLLTACGTKPETKLEVSRSFAISNGVFGGGLVVHGESASGKKVTISINGSNQKTLSLPLDVWTFYAIGWDGATPFFGNPYCGQVTQDTNTNTQVSISVTAAFCENSAFKTAVDLKESRFISCKSDKAYTNYNDSYSAITSTMEDEKCSTPGFATLNSELVNYRLVAFDVIDGVKTKVLSSSCYGMHTGYWQLKLPLNKFPFEVRGYQNANDCTADNAKYMKFTFNDGINTGNPEFDQIVQATTAPAMVGTRIILPSGLSRRFNSPFMNMIPQILCGVPGSLIDCIPDNTPSEATVHVRWTPGNGDYSILAQTNSSSCSASTLLPNSTLFYADQCLVEKGFLKARINRNAFRCQESTSDFSNIKDIAYAAGYVLIHYGSTNDLVKVYHSNGKFITTANLTGTSWKGLTAVQFAANAVNFYLTDGVDTVQKYSYSLQYGLVNQGSRNFDGGGSLGNIEDLAVSTNDNIFYSTADGKIGEKDWQGNTLIGIFATNGNPIPNIHYANGTILAIQDGSLKEAEFTSTTTGTMTPVTTSGAPSDVTSNGSNIFVIDTAGSIEIFASNLTSLGTPISTGLGSGPHSMMTNGTQLTVTKSTGLKMFNHTTGNSLPAISTHTGSCSEVTLVAGETHKFQAEKTNEHYDLFKNSYEIVGRRKMADAYQSQYTYGEVFNRDGQITSGGTLRRAQEMLSPSHISGIIGELGSTCTAIKALSLPIALPPRTIFDPFENETFTLELSVDNSALTIPQFLCVDNDPTGGSCASPLFDLKLAFNIKNGNVITEKAYLHLKCNSKTGILESYEFDNSNKWSRQYLAWNTNNTTYQRFEAYEKYKESSSEMSAAITKFQKTNANTFGLRSIRTHQMSGSSMAGHATEIERNSTHFFQKSDYITSTTWVGLMGEAAAATTTFAAASGIKCADISQNTKYSDGTLTCVMTGIQPQTDLPTVGSGISLSMDNLDLSDPTTLSSYFTLAIP